MKSTLLLLAILHVAEPYKILVFSAPLGYSHMQFMGQIADILQEAGHDVTVVHPVGMPKYVKAVSKLAKQVLFELPEETQKHLDPKNLKVWDTNSGSISQQIEMFNDFSELQIQICDLLLGDNRTIETLRREHFDVGITELLAICGFGVFNKVGIDHVIGTSAVGILETMGTLFDVPMLPSFVPSYLLPFTDRMNFLERTANFLMSFISQKVADRLILRYQNMWRHHGILGSEEDFALRVNYLLANSDEFLEFARPTTSRIIHIGGIALPKKEPLTSEFRELLERKDRVGAVYISFGSVVPTAEMPSYFREAILHVVREFPQITFLWKLDANDTSPIIPNLHTFAWLPQQALLDHPNLLCFVSHAGLNSVLEVTRSGKPSIFVPIFGDQMRNARLVEAKNTTIVVSKEGFNSDTFAKALQKILSDRSFAERAKRLSSLMTNKPFPVKERLLSTVEFSTRHGKIHEPQKNAVTVLQEIINVTYHIINVTTSIMGTHE
ncbi:hypothetical protein RB195_016251 [Necator americanus]|uniref:glucuronosyltransferase n=1 Tax=Necator americanus TaxID=51031 RepID=A0ABR1E8H4_NECAM